MLSHTHHVFGTTLSQHVGPTEGNFTLIHCDNIVFPTLAMDQQNEPMLAQRKHATVPHCFERVLIFSKHFASELSITLGTFMPQINVLITCHFFPAMWAEWSFRKCCIIYTSRLTINVLYFSSTVSHVASISHYIYDICCMIHW